MPLQHAEIEAQIARIEEQMGKLGLLLMGTLKSSPNRKIRKDGSVYVSKPYHSFPTRGRAPLSSGFAAWSVYGFNQFS